MHALVFLLKISFECASGRLRDSSLQAPWVCSIDSRGSQERSPYHDKLAIPHSPRTPKLPVFPKHWPIPKHQLPPAAGEEPQELLLRHSWRREKDCSCLFPMGREDMSPWMRGSSSGQEATPSPSRRTRPFLASLLAPRTVSPMPAVEATPSGRFLGFVLSKLLPRMPEIWFCLLHHHHQSWLPLQRSQAKPFSPGYLAGSKELTPPVTTEVGCTSTSTQSLAPVEHIVYPWGWDAFLKELCQHPRWSGRGASVIPAKNILCKEWKC